ncbi:DUF2570 domain-containing protein [Aeromonas sp. BIGb0445]|uniref:DUF2570 domain-containing protein n=1 Tax=Aeromonas sp. BIGb0445 TaxID=2940593 RepID=UPI002168160C|nr:DUF2570 domain-containing protein [Aeromonas sp. BIGb0445]MCS3459233.1 hypothetical protein [Aeromonas sp. BIGb0445]
MNRALLMALPILATAGWFWVMSARIDGLRSDLATAKGTINTLQEANTKQAKALAAIPLREKEIRQLLDQQNDALAKLDQQRRSIADELQHVLATPPVGRPDCSREPLPAGALRLLKPAAPGENRADQAAAATGAGAPLPGA